MSIVKYTPTESNNLMLGLAGAKIVVNTTAVTGKFCMIVPLEDTTFTSLTAPNIEGTAVGITWKLGSYIAGEITGFQLLTGKVIAYKA